MNFKVEPCSRYYIKKFIETWHYSKSINGLRISNCFRLMDGDKLIGAAIFGGLAMANQWKPYVSKESELVELRRLCCIDDTPKNTESYFISRCIKWITKNTDYKKIISYADKDYGHDGIIYKATHFKKVGETKCGTYIIWKGKKYHDKTIRAKNNNILKPYAKKIINALMVGDAKYEKSLGKNIFIYELKNRRLKQNSLDNFT